MASKYPIQKNVRVLDCPPPSEVNGITLENLGEGGGGVVVEDFFEGGGSLETFPGEAQLKKIAKIL